MLRCKVNAITGRSDAFMRQHGFVLPPFAYFREPVGRLSTIQEDTKPSHLPVPNYDTWLS